jgi:hypothetical protein
MRQKIRFEKNIKAGTLTILESSEVDSGIMMPLHEEEYNLAEMTAAAQDGLEPFMIRLRRRSFFPTFELCERLYEESRDFFENESMDKVVIDFQDSDSLPDDEDFRLEGLDVLDEDDDVELDALLDEDGDTKEDEIKEIDSEDDTPRFMPEDLSEHEN